MFDTRPALADMAEQIRMCRTGEGLTLQQLASRSGVAASTIHKVESQQMVPTVSVLLKIAKGLDRRPEELIRDRVLNEQVLSSEPQSAKSATKNSLLTGTPQNGAAVTTNATSASPAQTTESTGGSAKPSVKDSSTNGAPPFRAAIWRLGLSRDHPLPTVELESVQRAIVLVEEGAVEIKAGERRVQMNAGDCVEVEGGESIGAVGDQIGPASLTLIVSPPGRLQQALGAADAFRAASS